ncbi:MAG: DUF368 domain-containing protein [Treponema sp.]|nr:DUF368 domain-containing protein [Treponema sp.]
MEYVKLVLIGFVLGITAVIPGFSAATMAVVFNVYDRLINIIVPNIKKIFAAWGFWLPLIIGGAAGIIFFSKVFSRLMENYNVPAYWFFIGVIAGSIPLVYSRVIKPPSLLPSIPSVISFILALAIMIFMAIVKPEEGTAVYTELTPFVFALLTLAGALAAIAMIVPGISGAFMLLIIGLYRTVLQAVSDMNIPLLLPVVLGAGIGLLLGAAFVRFLLLKFPGQTYGAVLGLVTGSILVLYPGSFTFQARWGDGFGNVIVSVICLLTGFALSFLFGRRKKIN